MQSHEICGKDIRMRSRLGECRAYISLDVLLLLVNQIFIAIQLY